MTDNKSKRAVEYFHAAPNNWNCAQAIEKHFQSLTLLSDEEIENSFRCKGGGRAEGGICGALYAAKRILSEQGKSTEEFVEEFRTKMGGITCQVLKTELAIPCPQTVNTADELLKIYLASPR